MESFIYYFAGACGIVSIVWLLAFSYYRYKEERIYTEWENNKKQIQSRRVAMPLITGELKSIEKDYQLKLDRIKRVKQFLRDIVPFIKNST